MWNTDDIKTFWEQSLYFFLDNSTVQRLYVKRSNYEKKMFFRSQSWTPPNAADIQGGLCVQEADIIKILARWDISILSTMIMIANIIVITFIMICFRVTAEDHWLLRRVDDTHWRGLSVMATLPVHRLTYALPGWGGLTPAWNFLKYLSTCTEGPQRLSFITKKWYFPTKMFLIPQNTSFNQIYFTFSPRFPMLGGACWFLNQEHLSWYDINQNIVFEFVFSSEWRLRSVHGCVQLQRVDWQNPRTKWRGKTLLLVI